MEWSGVVGLGVAVAGAILALVVIFLIVDRLMEMARRQGRSSTERLGIALLALVGGPLAWLGLWWLLRDPPVAATMG